MKIQGNAIRCRCVSKERRAASQGEMNQNIVIPPSDLSNALLGCGDIGRGRHFYRLKCARLEVVPKEHATLPTSRIYILIAPVQNPPALAQVQELHGIFGPAGFVSGAR
jgi:hypothetical protein